ncbi:carbon starvation protein A [candidate division KSB1 bacterium]|nr:carbon starvation protein A [candidate division KSB1 bacterium]
MAAILILVISMALFILAYLTYGKYVARRLGVDPNAVTPAHTLSDGVDYVPTKSPVLLGHHFASIAGAGPIVGPIMAAVFGWVPVLLWIVLGGIFIGAVHDFTAIVASARHSGKSIGEVIEKYIGQTGKRLFLIFTWFTLILIIAVFTRLVATTFISEPAVATASILFMIIAILFGFGIYRRKYPLSIATIIGVILIFLCIIVGFRYPASVYPYFLDANTRTEITQAVNSGKITSSHDLTAVKNAFNTPETQAQFTAIAQAEEHALNFWIYALLVYVFLASVLPVWILLQPRDYLNSFLLYSLLILGVVGVFFYRPEMNLSRMTFSTPKLGFLFPVLFVTVACGAISGFHSLVASGTTSKQLNRETDAKVIGYGGMLIESILAVLALLAAAALSQHQFQALYAGEKFIPIFSSSVGNFMASIPGLNISAAQATTFSALAVSAFALTSLDTCTRLARYIFQEFFTLAGRQKANPMITNRYVCTLFSVCAGWLFVISGTATSIWPIFGSANQLLAALALLAVSTWLAYRKQKNLFVVIPMFFMTTVTLTALALFILKAMREAHYLLLVVAILLFGVAVVLVIQGVKTLFFKKMSNESRVQS